MSSPVAAPAARPPVNKWLVTLSVTFGTLMATIDSSIVNVGLPHIRGTVGATLQEITWITTGFVLASVIIMPLTAFLGRLFGQKRVYLFCLGLFIFGSALCGMARSLVALAACRVLQGIGAGALQPTEQAILRQTFPPKEQAMAMALFAMAIMVGPAIGPTLGGYIVDNWGWPWIFYINLPIGILGMAMVASFVREDPEILEKNRGLAAEQRRNIDWIGIALLSVGLATMQYFLEEGGRKDWFDSSLITWTFIVAIITLSAFVIREFTARVPAVNLRLFKDTSFLSGTLIGALMFAMLMANMFLLPVFMQELLGFTATQSGWALMPRVLVMMVATPIVGRIYNHVSPRLIIAIGVVFFAIGAWDMSHLTLGSGVHDVIRAVMIQGIGFSCLFVPLATVALASIPRHLMADATGLNSLLRQIGGSVGLAVFANLLDRYTKQGYASVAANTTITRPEVQGRLDAMTHGLMGHGFDMTTAREGAMKLLGLTVRQQAAALAFERVFLLAGIVFLCILPALFFLKVVRPEKTGEPVAIEL